MGLHPQHDVELKLEKKLLDLLILTTFLHIRLLSLLQILEDSSITLTYKHHRELRCLSLGTVVVLGLGDIIIISFFTLFVRN